MRITLVEYSLIQDEILHLNRENCLKSPSTPRNSVLLFVNYDVFCCIKHNLVENNPNHVILSGSS